MTTLADENQTLRRRNVCIIEKLKYASEHASTDNSHSRLLHRKSKDTQKQGTGVAKILIALLNSVSNEYEVTSTNKALWG